MLFGRTAHHDLLAHDDLLLDDQLLGRLAEVEGLLPDLARRVLAGLGPFDDPSRLLELVRLYLGGEPDGLPAR